VTIRGSSTKQAGPAPRAALSLQANSRRSIARKSTVSICLLSLLALSVAAAVTPAHAAYPVAPDVVVFCEPTLQHAVADLAVLWRKETHVPVRIFTSPTPAMLEQIAHHARDDVVIGEGDKAAAAAARQNLVKPDTVERLWRNHLVVAALRAGIEKASLGWPPAADNLAALAGKAPIAIVDPWAASAGADSQKALQALGLWQAVNGKLIGVIGTADAAYLLAQGKVRLAILYATDVAAKPAFAVTDRLPAASYRPIVYWAAQTADALSPNSAKFVAFLRQAQAQQRARADGLKVLP
jgi:molybdate transport system substrate-binding protein